MIPTWRREICMFDLIVANWEVSCRLLFFHTLLARCLLIKRRFKHAQDWTTRWTTFVIIQVGISLRRSWVDRSRCSLFIQFLYTSYQSSRWSLLYVSFNSSIVNIVDKERWTSNRVLSSLTPPQNQREHRACNDCTNCLSFLLFAPDHCKT
jgi:hypothetical protein